jgi:fibroblast growth factor receptor 2
VNGSRQKTNLILSCFDTGKYNTSDLDPLEIDDTLERDNNVQTDDFEDIATFPPRTDATTLSSNGYAPTFTNLNALNRLVVKPSGNMIKMKCPAKGDPDPTIEWSKDGKPIERAMGQVQSGKWSISLEDLIPSDSGSYTCKICNVHGCINFTAKVEVTGKS